MQIPRKPRDLNYHSQAWPRVASALYLLSTTGISARFELQAMLARQFGISSRSGSLRRIFEGRLVDDFLIREETLPTFGRHRLTVVRLTKEGRALCHSFGWEVVESDWDRLLRLHSADSQPRHTGAVLTFVHHARLRGWKTEVLPQVGNPVFFPDVLVEKDGQKLYVEVELGTRKASKWHNMQAFQGLVALCARTPESRKSLIAECRQEETRGLATDLTTLYRQSKNSDIGPLWAEEWS